MAIYLEAICLVLIISITAAQTESFFRKGPTNALKRVDESVTLECVTISRGCNQVDWQKVEGAQSSKLVYRNSSGMLNSPLYPPERYSVSDANGGCSLTIAQLKVDDSGKFICLHSVEDKEQTRTTVLIVISVTESCLPNVTSDNFAEGDGYRLRCTIITPAKSVEPSNVTLSFPIKAVGETEVTDSQPLSVSTALTGTAKREAITGRVCRASFAATVQHNYDDSNPSIDVCTSQPLNVSYAVEKVVVSSSGPYNKGNTVDCSAEGYPVPTFTWTNFKNETVVNIATLVIEANAGDTYTCTAMNTVKGTVTSQSVTIKVSAVPACGSSCITAIVISVAVIAGIITVVIVSWMVPSFPLYKKIHSINDKEGKKHSVQTVPLTGGTGTGTGPTKPPRAIDPSPKRPGSECNYAELRPDPYPHQMKTNPVNNSSTVYASVSIA